MTTITDVDLVRRLLAIRTYLSERADDLKKELAEWTAQEELIENEMLRRLNERQADNSKTEAGTFYKDRGTSTRVVDKVKFLDHVFQLRLRGEPNAYDMLTQAVAKDSVLAFMKDNAGQPPPGVEATGYIKIKVRKG